MFGYDEDSATLFNISLDEKRKPVSVSYTTSPSPRDRTRSRMPSSA